MRRREFISLIGGVAASGPAELIRSDGTMGEAATVHEQPALGKVLRGLF